MHLRKWGRPGQPAVLILQGHVPDLFGLERLGLGLAEKFYVVCPDRPGSGLSPALVPFTWAAIRDTIDGELARLQIHEAVVVAHSMGTYEALDLALNGRLRVVGLYLMAGFAGLDAAARASYVALAEGCRVNPAAIRSAYVEQAFQLSFASKHPDVISRFRADVFALDMESVASQLAAIDVLPDLRSELHRIRVPTLVRTGSDDAMTPIRWSSEIAGGIPNASLEEVPDRRHFLLRDDEDATRASIVSFLKRHLFDAPLSVPAT